MDYLQKLKYHYKPQKGWMNDPNGLVYFDGYYHIFYQHAPNHEVPWQEPMCWGHARTRDFLTYEELPIALYPDMPYDREGCWSGTAIVKDGVLYLFYAAITEDKQASVSVATSRDGIHFEKYAKNPIICGYPKDGGPDFRDPAVTEIDGKYYCVMASGNPEARAARLLLYKSEDLFDWNYCGIMDEWGEAKYTECPSFLPYGDGALLAVSVCEFDRHFFTLSVGDFKDGRFEKRLTASLDRGPDQYAGQVFLDEQGRHILMAWMPGWRYRGLAERDVGCLSVPRQITVKDGRLCAYPVKEVQHLLTDSDPAVLRTDDGFIIERTDRDPVVYRGEVRDLKILRDGYIVEVFVNGGEEIYTALL